MAQRRKRGLEHATYATLAFAVCDSPPLAGSSRGATSNRTLQCGAGPLRALHVVTELRIPWQSRAWFKQSVANVIDQTAAVNVCHLAKQNKGFNDASWAEFAVGDY